MNTKSLLCSGAFAAALGVGAFQIGCTSHSHSGGRTPASEGRVHEVPPGLQGADLANFEHLSEGADIYPYEWMRALKSVSFPNKEVPLASEYFLGDLDTKFGILPSPNLKNEQGKSFLMPHVGLTATWSSQPPQKSDAFLEEESEIVRNIGGVKSIKMVGTNCSLCHSGALNYKGTYFKVDGSPSIANVRGYFIDLAKSTIAVLAKQDRMEAFLKRLNVQQPEAKAKELNKYFEKRLAETTHGIIDAGGLSAKLTLLMAAKLNMKGRMFHAKEAISDTLLKLLKITYGFNESDNLGELPARMKFLGTLMVGTDPHTDETESGFGRTDAFGRIGNLVLRGDDPIGYTAPVSLPWIWGLKYMAMLHYNGNSNSVIMRNVGQSLGLGAIILDGKTLDSTTNVYNLDRMEHLVHKIPFPEWEKVFHGVRELEVKADLAASGKRIYEQNCQGCHESNRFVGPSGVLREYKIFPLDKVGTDPNSARNAVRPIGDNEFEKVIFEGVGGIKKRYYEKYNITKEQQDVMEFRSLRGNEFFRDTLLGFDKQEQFGNNYGNTTVTNDKGETKVITGLGYKARHLAGVWATAPYLHNGSVPTLWDLLQAPENRPKYFNVRSRDFDAEKLGYVSVREKNIFGHTKACSKSESICFDTTITGNHNGGHVYGTSLSDGEKMALLEYLKVLAPEPEYAWY